MSKTLEEYLLEAAGKDQDAISSDNPYLELGFDQGKKRLGWVEPVDFVKIEESLDRVAEVLKGKDTFVFVGMGGSINGIKPLLAIFNKGQYYTLDNLDPAAVSSLAAKVKDPDKTLVISISKSGTTAETQLLSQTLRELFIKKLGTDKWQKHFLWLSDQPSFSKLDSLGWQSVLKESIQPDSQTDIGGRFSSPHTLIFLLPLYLLLDRDKSKLKQIYDSFCSLERKIREKAYFNYEKYKDNASAYFYPVTSSSMSESFSSWVVQLFQESLGSKLEKFPVKTITKDTKDGLFSPICLGMDITDKVTCLMAQMHFFQVFIAYFSAAKNLNFVSQNFVEKYKDQMRKLESGGGFAIGIETLSLEAIIDKVKQEVSADQIFIEIVLYLYPQPDLLEKIRAAFCKEFPSKQILIFIGSDWNHQSYQAAFSDESTFYVLILSSSYAKEVENINSEAISKNTKTLENIAKATYLTLKGKSTLVAYNR